MGMLRALVVLVLVVVAVSPLAGNWLRLSADIPSVYADSVNIGMNQKHPDRDKDKKEKNRDDQDDEDERGNRHQTQEEKDQLQRDNDLPRNTTNAYAQDNFELEGNVVRLNCQASPKEIVITTLDGEATLYQGPRDAQNRIDRLYCGDLMVGDYVFVQEAQKRSEQAYDAYYISCQKEREEGPDNTNDNADDIDPNCTHIWHRA